MAGQAAVDGTPFGRYRLVELLGRGGMGEVWRAYDTDTDRIVAIKVLPAHFSDNEDFKQRFRREAHAAARLNTPHVVPIHHYGEIDGRLYVDMRLIEGRDLQTVLADGPLPPGRAVRIIEGVALALHAAHKVGLLHRDVKPSNILLDENDFAYLIDFGIARAADETRMTKSGHMIGTFAYIAPERLDPQNDEDARADVYSLACVLYECLTGGPPFPGDSMPQLVAAHLNAPPPRPSVSHPEVPAPVDEVIARGMAKDPDERYPTTVELANAAHEAITVPIQRPTTSTLTLPATEQALPPTQRAGNRVTARPRTANAASLASTKPAPPPQPPPTPVRAGGISRRTTLALIAGAVALVAGIAAATILVVYRPWERSYAAPPTAVPSTGAKSDAAFNRANAGDCLTWPDITPESASIVNCGDDHKFEVAESIDMRTFPGSEYGPNAAPPSPARIQQISQEQCGPAVRRYLGPKFDPNSKFSVSMLWSGDRAWRQSGERRMLCGLQLPGPDNQQTAFKGKVADIDQSKVWPAGTCLGIDPTTNQPIDVPVDCAAPHAMEVTGTVNLAEKFPAALPAEPEQDGFIKDSCTKMTDAYLAPIKLRTTTLSLIYPTVSMPSWQAGSRKVACSIGASLGNGDWATLVNSAKGALLINGQAPVPPP